MNEPLDHTNPSKDAGQTRSMQPEKKASPAFLFFSWILVFGVLALIFFMSARSGEALDTNSGIITIIRNALLAASSALFGHAVDVSPIGHFAEYFLLGITLTNALRLSLPLPRAAAFATLLASIYGVSDELHQLFVPGRSCDPMDWLVDTIAAFVASLVFVALSRAHQKRKDSRLRSDNISL